MRFRGVSVVVNLQAAPRADVQRIERDVQRALYTYLNPLIGGGAGAGSSAGAGSGDGWPAGRSLNQGELYAIVNAFEGVEFVRVLRLYAFDLRTGERDAKSGRAPDRHRGR